MNIYRYLDYREIIEKVIEFRKKTDSKVNHARLAEALRIQKTYVSRVLKKSAHFSSDQLYLTCRYLGFNRVDTNYLFLLLEFDRTALADRKKELSAQIRQIQSERTKIQKHLQSQMIEPKANEKYFEYYLDPRAILVHVFLNIPDYRRNPQKIRQALSIPDKQFNTLLQLLERLEIIRWNELQKAYDLLVDDIHLPKESALSFPAEQLSRMMVLDHLKKLPMNERFYYSVTFSADEKTRATVHEEFLKFLRKTDPEITAAPSENVYHMTFDLFPWKVES